MGKKRYVFVAPLFSWGRAVKLKVRQKDQGNKVVIEIPILDEVGDLIYDKYFLDPSQAEYLGELLISSAKKIKS